MSLNVLVVDDEPGILRAVSAELEDQGYEVLKAGSGSEALLRFREHPCELVVTDLKMDGIDGMELLKELKREQPATEVLMMTAHGTVETAVEALRVGAYDYIQKPFDMDDFVHAVGRMAEKVGLSSENTRLRADLKERHSFDNVIGASGAMQNVFRMVERVAKRDATVLLRGESGTGKEVVAKLIHHQSARSDGPFLAVNCAAIPENLLESELFGHEKGAFTGAVGSRLGLFREADGGTLFLDEIGEVGTNIQVKLLRALQEQEVQPVGGRGPVPINARIVAATNRELEVGLKEGWFREDLYYRLSVFPIFVPPLRERRDDVEPLAAHFLEKSGHAGLAFDAEAMQRLLGYAWPGNVRELENIVQRAALMTDGEVIGTGALPNHVTGRGPIEGTAGAITIPEEGLNLEALEEDLIRQAIRKAQGNKTRAAELLGITRRTLYSRLDRMGWKVGDEP